MKLVEIRCPNCGGELKVNPEKEKLVCGYCHTEFFVDDEIKRIETHHIYTDEAKVIRAESEKEIELKKLEIEEKQKEFDKKVTKIMGIITVIGIIIAILFMAFGEESEITSLFIFMCIGWMWIGRIIIKGNNKNKE